MRHFLAIMMLALVMSSTPDFGVFGPPPEKPDCKEGEEIFCTYMCISTLVNCGPFGGFDKDGKWEVTYDPDCNKPSCTWNCNCIKVHW